MADVTKTLQIIISAQDEASAAIRNTSGSMQMMGDVLAALGLANLTYDLIQLGRAAFDTGLQFNKMTEDIQGNTGMSDAELAKMQKAVMDLAQQSGLASTDIADSFQYAYDATQNYDQALQITTAAMEAVRVHGGSVTEAVKILSTAMHDYNIPADEANQTMSKILTISQQSKSVFADLNSQFSVLIATAASAGVPLDQVGALFDALTRKLGDANRASTEGMQFLLALEAAHKSVKAAIGDTTTALTAGTKAHKDYSDQIAIANDRIKSEEDRLKSAKDSTTAQKDAYQSLTDTIKSHQDALTSLEAKQNNVSTTAMGKVDPALRGLAADFTDSGIKAKGLYGILTDINNAADHNTAELQKLFPNYRALYASMSLTSDKGADVKQSLEAIDKASANQLNAEYQERLQKTDTKFGILSETLKNKAIVAFNALSPVMNVTLDTLTYVADHWNGHLINMDTDIDAFVKKSITSLTPFFASLPKSFDLMHQRISQGEVKLWDQDIPHAVGVGVGWVLWTGLPNLYNGTIQSFTKMYNDLGPILLATWKSVTDMWTKTSVDSYGIFSLSNVNIGKLFTQLQQTADNDMKQLYGIITGWWNQIQNIFNNIVKAAENVIKTVSNAFSSGVASQIPHRAGGGWAGGLTLVGEAGPELIDLPAGSYVHNTSETQNMMGGGNVTIQFNGGVMLDSPDRVQQLANQIIRVMGRQNELARKGYSV